MQTPISLRRGAMFAWPVAAALAMAGTATGAVTVDTFDGGTSSGGWSFGFFDEFPDTGGNPGYYLHNPTLDTFAPILMSAPSVVSPFTGDLRAAQVTSMGLDARVDRSDFGASGEGFQLSLLLRSYNGTPDDYYDDDYAYFVGTDIPQPGQGWVSHDFSVPSASLDPVPAGWRGGWSDDPENFRPGVTWSDIITHVDQVEFWFLDPRYFAIFQQFDVGADNVRVTNVPEPSTLALGGLLAGLVLRRRSGARS